MTDDERRGRGVASKDGAMSVISRLRSLCIALAENAAVAAAAAAAAARAGDGRSTPLPWNCTTFRSSPVMLSDHVVVAVAVPVAAAVVAVDTAALRIDNEPRRLPRAYPNGCCCCCCCVSPLVALAVVVLAVLYSGAMPIMAPWNTGAKLPRSRKLSGGPVNLGICGVDNDVRGVVNGNAVAAPVPA